jgi:ubiquinone/menaquinone biosynthesis C-methylase UbiE
MTALATPEQNKEIYGQYHDQIIEKRFQSDSPIRRHAHHSQYQAIADLVPAGSTVLDSGCGEGILCVMLAKKGCIVTGVDLSEPNIAACKKYAAEQGLGDSITFLVGDAENLPAADKSFDYVVSSHVLEHVPDFVKGVRELKRVARLQVIAAIPTCLNPCAWVLLAHDKYWRFSRRTIYALPLGLLYVLGALLLDEEGVNEGYAGHSELIHIWRFPRRGKQLMKEGGLKVIKYRGSSYIFPYFAFLLPLSKLLQKGCWLPGLRNFGYGTTYVCDPN